MLKIRTTLYTTCEFDVKFAGAFVPGALAPFGVARIFSKFIFGKSLFYITE
jgi:hypothetical protein